MYFNGLNYIDCVEIIEKVIKQEFKILNIEIKYFCEKVLFPFDDNFYAIKVNFKFYIEHLGVQTRLYRLNDPATFAKDLLSYIFEVKHQILYLTHNVNKDFC